MLRNKQMWLRGSKTLREDLKGLFHFVSSSRRRSRCILTFCRDLKTVVKKTLFKTLARSKLLRFLWIKPEPRKLSKRFKNFKSSLITLFLTSRSSYYKWNSIHCLLKGTTLTFWTSTKKSRTTLETSWTRLVHFQIWSNPKLRLSTSPWSSTVRPIFKSKKFYSSKNWCKSILMKSRPWTRETRMLFKSFIMK